MADDGLFAFSLETFDGDGFRLATMRFAHSREYLERTAEASPTSARTGLPLQYVKFLGGGPTLCYV